MIAISVDERGATADAAGQITAAVAVGAALGGIALVWDLPWVFLLGWSALLCGMALGNLLPDRAVFDNVSGVGAAALVFCGGFFLWAVAAYAAEVPPPPTEILAVLGVVVGLDWDRVTRLRVRVVGSGVWLLPAIAWGDDPQALPTAVAWVVAALVALWVLQRDGQRVVTRPTPLHAGAATPRPLDPLEVLGVVGGAVALALLLSLAVPALRDLLAGDDESTSSTASSPSAPGGSGSVRPGPGGELYYDRDGQAYRYDPGTDTWERVPGADGGGGTGSGGGEVGPGGELPGTGPSGEVPGSGSGGPGVPGDAGSSAVDDDGGPDAGDLLVVLGVVATLAALAAVGWRWWSRRAGAAAGWVPLHRPWAEAATQRLLAEGERRGRTRAPHESIASYGRALADGLADPRLAGVGLVLSAALFGPSEPSDAERAWVDAVLAELAAGPDRAKDAVAVSAA